MRDAISGNQDAISGHHRRHDLPSRGHHSAVVGEAISGNQWQSVAISEIISKAISEAIDEVMRDLSCQPVPIRANQGGH
jgi:hypothetical protein